MSGRRPLPCSTCSPVGEQGRRETPGSRRPQSPAERAPPVKASFRTGDIIDGKYRVERVLGQGGMGVVVAARHVRLGERVAIKFPLARLALRTDLTSRLFREGRAAMRIRSEHVARVHDVSTLATGEPYLIMEYLDGRDLDAVITDTGPLPIDAAIEYVLQASEALAEAHSLGIIHRDLKPSNLFLSRRADGSPMIKVIDFGIAKSIDDVENAGAPFTTAANAVLGSPLYMSPEQMRAAPHIDARTDIWALGATLHCLVTGAAPFPGASILEIHERILLGAPPIRASQPEVPEALEAIILRCLRRDPDERYPSIAALAEALAELAPEHARISAQRAARILMAGPPVASAMADGDTVASVPSAIEERTADEEGAQTTAPVAGASWADAAPVPPVSGAPAPRSPPRSVGWQFIGPIAIASVTAAAAGAILALAARGPHPADPPASSAPSLPSTYSSSRAVATMPREPFVSAPPTVVSPEAGALTPPRARVPSADFRPQRAPPHPAPSASSLPSLPSRHVDPLADPD